jgi:hypothetical protein
MTRHEARKSFRSEQLHFHIFLAQAIGKSCEFDVYVSLSSGKCITDTTGRRLNGSQKVDSLQITSF